MQEFLVQFRHTCKCCGKEYTSLSSETYICGNCNQALSVTLCPECKQKEYKCPVCGATKSSIKQGHKGCLVDFWEVGNGPEMEVKIENNSGILPSQFETWLRQKGKAESTAADYCKRVFSWANNLESLMKFAFFNLNAIYANDQELGESVSSWLIALVHKNKYAYYKEAQKGTSKKKRQKAAKAGNTTDNMVTFVNQYIKFCKESIVACNLLDFDRKEELSVYVKKWRAQLTKNPQEIKRKIITSLTSQDRAYRSIKRWDGKKELAFPITLISKILSRNRAYQQWKDNVFNEIKVYTNRNSEPIPIANVKSMTIEPYKRIVVEVSNKKYYLKTRKDTDSPLKILKVAEFGEISIGHMPPISEVLMNLETDRCTSLPAIEKLSDIISSYFKQNNIDFVQKNVQNGQLMKAIYKDTVWDDEFKELLLADMAKIHSREKYELQGKAENSSMGGINRK